MPRLASNRLVNELQRRTITLAYGDTGNLLVDTVTDLDSYGQPTVSTASTSVACSFTDKPDVENWQDYADIQEISAEVRFSSPAPSRGNRFTVTGRWDDASFTDATFEIVDIRDRGDFGYVCALKKVQI